MTRYISATHSLLLAGLAAATFAMPAHTSDESTLVRDLEHRWAVATYQTPADDREAALKQLAADAGRAAETHPGSAELLAWHGIILSSYAGEAGGLGALDLAKSALKSLEAAAKIDEAALGGGIDTSIGALYYKVPGWPLGFGDDDKAAEYLQKGLALNPTGIDENYFYGDYLLDQGHEKEALAYLQKAAQAPERPGRSDADLGRRADIAADIAKIRN